MRHARSVAKNSVIVKCRSTGFHLILFLVPSSVFVAGIYPLSALALSVKVSAIHKQEKRGCDDGDIDDGGASSGLASGFLPRFHLGLVDRLHGDRTCVSPTRVASPTRPCKSVYIALVVFVAVFGIPALRRLLVSSFILNIFRKILAAGLADRTGSAGRRYGVVGWRTVQRQSALETTCWPCPRPA